MVLLLTAGAKEYLLDVLQKEETFKSKKEGRKKSFELLIPYRFIAMNFPTYSITLRINYKRVILEYNCVFYLIGGSRAHIMAQLCIR